MGKTKRTIPKAPIKRLLKEAGAKQVSNKAVDEFIGKIKKDAETAVVLAKHAKRTRVLPQDIPGSETKVRPPRTRRPAKNKPKKKKV